MKKSIRVFIANGILTVCKARETENVMHTYFVRVFIGFRADEFNLVLTFLLFFFQLSWFLLASLTIVHAYYHKFNAYALFQMLYNKSYN